MATALHNVNVFAAIVESKLTAIRNDTARGAFVLGKQSRRKIHAFEPRETEALQRDQAIPAAAKKFYNPTSPTLAGAQAVQAADQFAYFFLRRLEMQIRCFPRVWS
jgi:hypothetical protein